MMKSKEGKIIPLDQSKITGMRKKAYIRALFSREESFGVIGEIFSFETSAVITKFKNSDSKNRFISNGFAVGVRFPPENERVTLVRPNIPDAPVLEAKPVRIGQIVGAITPCTPTIGGAYKIGEIGGAVFTTKKGGTGISFPENLRLGIASALENFTRRG